MTDATIRVGTAVTRIYGLPGLRASDIYANAPEPAPADWNGIRSTSANLTYLDETLPGSRWEDPQNRRMEAAAIQQLRDARPTWVVGDYEKDFPFNVPPYDFQLAIFAQARKMTNIALSPCAPGVGKTRMILDICADKFRRGEIDALAVVAPNMVNVQWVKEAVPTHLVSACPRAAAVWSPTRKVPADVAKETTPKKLRILSFNVEAFSSEAGKAAKALAAFLDSGRVMLVIDEHHKIKNPRAARTKAVLKLREKAAVRAILSGTPITRGVEDIYTGYAFLDPSLIGQTNYYTFRSRYCVLAPSYRGAPPGAVNIVGYRNVQELLGKVAPVTFTVDKSVLGLPAKRYDTLPVALSPEQEAAYIALRDQIIADLHAKNISSPANAAVRFVRLQQILSGRVYSRDEDDTEIPREIPSLRVATLVDFLKESDGEQAVIWSRFTADIVAIAAALRAEGKTVVTYYGATPRDERTEAVRAFKAGEASYFVGNPAAAGVGIDGLQVAELVVFFSNSFSLEARIQAEDRTHRIGTTGSVLYIDMVARVREAMTIDGLVLKNLHDKTSLADAVYRDPALLLGDG